MTKHIRALHAHGIRRLSRLFVALFVGAALAGFPMLARAQHGGHDGGDSHGGSGWHGGGGGSPHGGGSWHGSAHDWHGGHWYHGWHGNQFGWWWNVPGYDWYSYYDTPNYPIPAYPYGGYPYGAPAAPNLWYYCQNPPGYYPYVQQCAGPWQPVPAAPGG